MKGDNPLVEACAGEQDAWRGETPCTPSLLQAVAAVVRAEGGNACAPVGGCSIENG